MDDERNQGYRAAILLTKTNQAASATNYFPSSTGQDRLGSTGLWSQVNAHVWANQTGTLTLEVADVMGTWSTLGTPITVSASDVNEYGWTTLTKRFWRWKYVNDADATTEFRLYEDKITGSVRSQITAAIPAGTNNIGDVDTMGQYTTKTVTIANAASLSDEVDLEGYKLAGIIMPAAWTAATLTFAAATASGGTFNAVYDDTGTEVQSQAAASRSIAMDTIAGALAPFRFLKIRSGTSGTAVAQGAERTLTLVLKS